MAVDNWAVKMTADISNFDSKMDDVLRRVNSVQSKITNLSANVSNSVNQSVSSVSSSTKNITNNISSVTNQMNNFGSAMAKVGGIIAGALSVGALVSFGKSCVSLASDLAEVQNVIDVAFPTMSKRVNEFASTAMESFGLSEKSAKQYMGTLGAMIKSMGLSESSAETMAEKMTGLAGDMASFYNLDTDAAFAKIRSGLSGETEPLKQLGINLSQANLEAYALSQGITTAYSSMSEAEKVMLRYNYILSVTGDAQGDFARTSDSWANQVRILSGNFDRLKTVLGQGLIQALTPVIQIINELMEKLIVLGEKFRDVVYKITGKEVGTDESSSNSSTTYDYTTADVDTAQSDVADATATTADKKSSSALSKANKVASTLKAAQSLVLKFDELNKENDNNTDAGSLSSNAGTDVADAQNLADAMDSVASTDLSNLVSDLGAVDSVVNDASDDTETWLDNLLGVFDVLGEKLKEAATNFKAGLDDALGDDFDERLSNLGDDFVSLTTSIVGVFNDDGVQQALSDYNDALAKTAGQVVGAGVNVGTTATEFVVGSAESYVTENTADVIEDTKDILGHATEVTAGAGDTVSGVAKILSAFGSEGAQKIGGDMVEGAIGILKTSKFGRMISFGSEAVSEVGDFFSENSEDVRKTLNAQLEDLSTVTGKIADAWNYVGDAKHSLDDWFADKVIGGAGDAISAGFGGLLKGVNWITGNYDEVYGSGDAEASLLKENELLIADSSGGKIMDTETAVVDSNFITASMSAGVDAGISSATATLLDAFNTENEKTRDIVINLDGEEVGRGVQKAMANRDKRNSMTINYAY